MYIKILDQIDSPEKIRELNMDELEQLAEEIRGFLVEKVSAVDNVIASLPELVDKVAALIKKEKPGADASAE